MRPVALGFSNMNTVCRDLKTIRRTLLTWKKEVRKCVKNIIAGQHMRSDHSGTNELVMCLQQKKCTNISPFYEVTQVSRTRIATALTY